MSHERRRRAVVNDIVHLEGLRKAPQQADEMFGRLGERLAFAREYTVARQAFADFERQHDEQLASHVIAHDRLGQHGDGVETFEQLQRSEDGRGFGEIDGRAQTGACEFAFEQLTRGTRDWLCDPRPVHQFRERDLLAFGKRMARTHDEHERFASERLEAEIVVLKRRREAPQREIDFAAMQQLHDLVAGFAEYAHVQQRALGFKRRHGLRKQVGCGAHDRAHGELTVTAATFDVEVFGKTSQFGERAARVSERDDAERGGLHTARVALEEAKAECFFDIAEHTARAGLRDVDGIGGLMHVARVVERDEQSEMLEPKSIDECDDSSLMIHRHVNPGDPVYVSPDPNIGLVGYRRGNYSRITLP